MDLMMQIDGLYNLEGIALAVFPLYGDGPYRVEIFEVNMLGGGSMGLDETGNYLQVLYTSQRNTWASSINEPSGHINAQYEPLSIAKVFLSPPSASI